MRDECRAFLSRRQALLKLDWRRVRANGAVGGHVPRTKMTAKWRAVGRGGTACMALGGREGSKTQTAREKTATAPAREERMLPAKRVVMTTRLQQSAPTPKRHSGCHGHLPRAAAASASAASDARQKQSSGGEAPDAVNRARQMAERKRSEAPVQVWKPVETPNRPR